MTSELVFGILLTFITTVICGPVADQRTTNDQDWAALGYDGNPASCSRTGFHSEAWWSIDLDTPQVINNVTLDGSMIGSPKIYVDNVDGNGNVVSTVCAVWFEPPTLQTNTFTCKKAETGNRVRIESRARRDDQYVQLEICETYIA